MLTRNLALLALAGAALALPAGAAEIDRTYATPQAYIAGTALVPAGAETLYVSGQVPDVADPSAPRGAIEAYGDTETQSMSVFGKIEALLKAHGMGMGDVVQMHVFLVGDPSKDGTLDFQGMMRAYLRYFGTPAQPHRPTRSTVQVAALANPGFLVEIEVVAAKTPRP